MDEASGLAFIEVADDGDPNALFREWIDEAKSCGISWPLMNLATATKTGKVSNRTVVVRDILSDGSLVIMTTNTGRKFKDISENPQVAATVLLQYLKDDKSIARQIRFEGVAEQLASDQCRVYYDREPLYCKIRGWLCQQGSPTEWEDLKKRHDALYKDVVENKRELAMPENTVAFKIMADRMDFYSAWNCYIADRLEFTKKGSEWKMRRIQA